MLNEFVGNSTVRLRSPFDCQRDDCWVGAVPRHEAGWQCCIKGGRRNSDECAIEVVARDIDLMLWRAALTYEVFKGDPKLLELGNGEYENAPAPVYDEEMA